MAWWLEELGHGGAPTPERSRRSTVRSKEEQKNTCRQKKVTETLAGQPSTTASGEQTRVSKLELEPALMENHAWGSRCHMLYRNMLYMTQ